MNKRAEVATREESSLERNHDTPRIAPLVDIYENNDEILLHVDMPGVDKKDIAVNIDNGKLFLSGIRRIESIGSAQWEEFGDLEYMRTFSVPQTIDSAKVNAELKDGVLRLHLPKSEAAKPRQIEIKSD
ncbi:MAG: Hsp20/alpha crystallin family protein [Desulfobulbaceae bacterium]|nr:Hsp20/alpha crystallin family protein [Desulfobulbaceae bacterium]